MAGSRPVVYLQPGQQDKAVRVLSLYDDQQEIPLSGIRLAIAERIDENSTVSEPYQMPIL